MPLPQEYSIVFLGGSGAQALPVVSDPRRERVFQGLSPRIKQCFLSLNGYIRLHKMRERQDCGSMQGGEDITTKLKKYEDILSSGRLPGGLGSETFVPFSFIITKNPNDDRPVSIGSTDYRLIFTKNGLKLFSNSAGVKLTDMRSEWGRRS